MSTDFGTSYNEDEAYQAALKRAEALQGYYIHLLIFAVVNAGLFLINLLTRGEDGSWWCVWVLAVWGIAVVINTLVVFAGVFTEGWKERKADELYRRGRQHVQGGGTR